MKNAIYCTLFGLLCAFAACSATKLAKRNIHVQKADTANGAKQQPLQQTPPSVPSFVLLRGGYQTNRNADFRPFKDSLINGLKNIKEGIDQANSKLDTGLIRQNSYINVQQDVVTTLFSLQAKINSLEHDTTRLMKNAIISKEVKDDATFGNTYKQFSVYVLLFIAAGIIAILIMIFVVHNILSKHVQRLKQHA